MINESLLIPAAIFTLAVSLGFMAFRRKLLSMLYLLFAAVFFYEARRRGL